MANTTFSRVGAENIGASRVLAAVSRLTATIRPTSPSASAWLRLTEPSCQCRSRAGYADCPPRPRNRRWQRAPPQAVPACIVAGLR